MLEGSGGSSTDAQPLSLEVLVDAGFAAVCVQGYSQDAVSVAWDGVASPVLVGRQTALCQMPVLCVGHVVEER